MARDHRRLRVFHAAHTLALDIYKETRSFPRDEWFGLRRQIRRAAVAVPTNVVEGSARRGGREYANFVNISRASAGETAYLVVFAKELGYLSANAAQSLERKCNSLIPQLESLLQEIEQFVHDERELNAAARTSRRSKAEGARSRTESPQPKA